MKLVLLVQTQTDREVLIRKAQATEDFCLVCLIDLCASSSCKVLVLTKTSRQSRLFSHTTRTEIQVYLIGPIRLDRRFDSKASNFGPSLQNGAEAAFCGLGQAARKPDPQAASPPVSVPRPGDLSSSQDRGCGRTGGPPRLSVGAGAGAQARPHLAAQTRELQDSELSCRLCQCDGTTTAAGVCRVPPSPAPSALAQAPHKPSQPLGPPGRVRAPPEATEACSRVQPLQPTRSLAAPTLSPAGRPAGQAAEPHLQGRQAGRPSRGAAFAGPPRSSAPADCRRQCHESSGEGVGACGV